VKGLCPAVQFACVAVDCPKNWERLLRKLNKTKKNPVFIILKQFYVFPEQGDYLRIESPVSSLLRSNLTLLGELCKLGGKFKGFPEMELLL
jgi:hypothetical protein